MPSEEEFVAKSTLDATLEQVKIFLDLSYKIAAFDSAAIVLSVTFAVGLIATHKESCNFHITKTPLLYASWFVLLTSVGAVVWAIFLLSASLHNAFEGSFILGTTLRNIEATSHTITEAQQKRIKEAEANLHRADGLLNSGKITCLWGIVGTLLGTVLLVVYASIVL